MLKKTTWKIRKYLLRSNNFNKFSINKVLYTKTPALHLLHEKIYTDIKKTIILKPIKLFLTLIRNQNIKLYLCV